MHVIRSFFFVTSHDKVMNACVLIVVWMYNFKTRQACLSKESFNMPGETAVETLQAFQNLHKILVA